MTLDRPSEFCSIEKVALKNPDGSRKCAEPLRRANDGCYRMATFQRLPNNFYAYPASGA